MQNRLPARPANEDIRIMFESKIYEILITRSGFLDQEWFAETALIQDFWMRVDKGFSLTKRAIA